MDNHAVVLLAGVLLAGLVLGYRAWLRPWMYGWGADPDELAMSLRGDALVPFGSPITTRAITIAAPADHVWDWLSQLGEDNAGSLNPLRRDLCVGDTLWLAAGCGDHAAQQVAMVETDAQLVLVSATDFRRLERGEQTSGHCEFVLRPAGGGTRLIVRRSGELLGHCAFDVTQFVVERSMMRGIRNRAQRSWAARQSSG